MILYKKEREKIELVARPGGSEVGLEGVIMAVTGCGVATPLAGATATGD